MVQIRFAYECCRVGLTALLGAYYRRRNRPRSCSEMRSGVHRMVHGMVWYEILRCAGPTRRNQQLHRRLPALHAAKEGRCGVVTWALHQRAFPFRLLQVHTQAARASVFLFHSRRRSIHRSFGEGVVAPDTRGQLEQGIRCRCRTAHLPCLKTSPFMSAHPQAACLGSYAASVRNPYLGK